MRKRDLQYPEETKLGSFRNASVEDAISFFEGHEVSESEQAESPGSEWQPQSLFQGFLDELRARDIRVSTPEWMHFLTVIERKFTPETLKKLSSNEQLFETLRVYARTTLIKNKENEPSFNEAFNDYFLRIAQIIESQIPIDQQKENEPDEKASEERQGEEPEMKEQTGIQEVDENLHMTDSERDSEQEEQVHGGKKDQHNDILKKEDTSKIGGGSKKDTKAGGEGDKGEKSEGKGDKGEAGEGKGDKGKPSGMGKGGAETQNDSPTSEVEQQEQTDQKPGSQEMQTLQEEGLLKGRGKGKSIQATPISVASDDRLTHERARKRMHSLEPHDKRDKYERRPERADIREIIRNLRRIIQDVSQVKTGKVDVKSTVRRFARKDFRVEYRREREKQPEIVLFIDVGGPVDEWSPLIKEVAEEMTNGLTKLEVYLFHNNIYGFVWPIHSENHTDSNIPKPGTIKSIKDVVKKRKKVIIYGDGEISDTELHDDMYKGRYPDQEKIDRSYMDGEECLRFMQRKSDSTVWINPIFRKEWQERDASGAMEAIQDIVPMHDLSVGGVQDAIKELMKR